MRRYVSSYITVDCYKEMSQQAVIELTEDFKKIMLAHLELGNSIHPSIRKACVELRIKDAVARKIINANPEFKRTVTEKYDKRFNKVKMFPL